MNILNTFFQTLQQKIAAVIKGGNRSKQEEERVYLNVPYPQKDLAKNLGAKWDHL